MRWVSNKSIEQLRAVAELPDFSGTRFRLIREIARGGMGAVYLCEDAELGRSVAVKVLDDTGRRRTSPSRMLREARIVARLEHPGIVPVHDVGTLPDGRIFYSMKLVRGSRLDEHFKQVDSMAERLRVFLAVCQTIAFAHAHGVIHRDLKPANIMVGQFGEVLVIDWGVAKVIRQRDKRESEIDDRVQPDDDVNHRDLDRDTSEETVEGTVIGTPAYMAPEQEQGENAKVDERSDIYALGAILYFLLTNRTPSRIGVNQEVSATSAPQGMTFGLEVSKPLRAICLKAMDPEKQVRYQQVAELMADVGKFLEGEPVSAYRENPFERVSRLVSKHRFIVLLVLAYLIMRVVLIFYAKF